MSKIIPIAKPIVGEDEISAVVAVLRSGIIVQGKKVEEFEEAFAEVDCPLSYNYRL